ncbi:MAG: hypothetical protein ABSD75_08870, partial [Terriglobales bacterium]
MKITRTLLRQAAAVSALPSTLILSLALGHPQLVYGQTGGQTDIPAKVAVLHPPLPAPDLSASAATSADPVSLDVAKELAALKARIELLEAELKSRSVTTNASLAPVVPAKETVLPVAAPAQAMVAQPSGDTSTAESTKKEKIAPFSDWDWTWLNGNPRN